MRFRYGLLIGVMVGWMLEQVWGKLSGRPQTLELLLTAKDEARQWQLKALELEQRQAQLLSPAQAEALQQQLGEARLLIEELQIRLSNLPNALTRIKGIGRAFAEKLNAAGIYRFNDLAALSPDEIIDIIDAKPWQKVEPEKWIAQAKKLAASE